MHDVADIWPEDSCLRVFVVFFFNQMCLERNRGNPIVSSGYEDDDVGEANA